ANIMNWTFDHSFTLAANFHGGALVVNYPFDTNSSGSSVYTACPDDDLFISISEEYSVHNSPMWNSPSFFHGITNGAAWYAISGGMQDWLYIYEGGNEVTIELSDNKIPPANQISAFWNDNRESMLSFMETALTGVRGVVTDANTGLPVAATITVEGRDHAVYTDPDVGDYHRMLLPGTYDLRIDADGYDPVVFPNVTVPSGDALRLDVALGAPAQVTYPNGGETLHTGQTANVQWTGSPAAQFHVQYTLNADDTATITDGFERSSLGGDYQTGGNANWYIASGTSHAGNKAARGGNINDNQTTWMTRSVQNGGSLSFWYKVSSEESYDFFNFYIDGQSKVSISGQTGWIQYSTTLAPGAHTLRWEYSKDVSISEGSDTAWIDDLQLTDDNTTWTDIVNLTGVGQTSVAWTPDSTSSNAKVRVRAYYGNGIYGEWDESDAAFTIAEGVNCPGDLDGDSDVDQADLGLLLSAYGNGAGGDLDGDGDTDQADLGLLLSNYGTTCG
ncbi:MAG TPA: hypothetical protein ENJ06_01945, partial [Phycisphaeraceae bacterium]|nr:hypothetical protein [Phycisphaeraceae bacterium]